MRRRAPALLALGVALLLLLGPAGVPSAISGADVLYTANVDFARGTLVGVDARARDQLGLTASGGMLRLLWLTRDFDSSDSSCTLVKIDTDTGAVLGEYRAVSEGDYCNSDEGWNFALIAVAPNGSAWHARTDADPELATDAGDRVGRTRALDQRVVNGGPTQVGLEERGQCVDRNGNGRIDTSTGLGDIRPWPGRDSLVANAADECTLTHVEPSAFGLGGARFLGVDRSGRLWLRDRDGRYLRFDATGAGERVAGPMPCDADCLRRRGGRQAVTPNGDTWAGSLYPNKPGEGLHHTGGVLRDGNTWPTAVAVDGAGKPWIHEGYLGRARRVDPSAGPLACGGTGCGSGRLRLGAFDLTVSLSSKHVVGGISGWMTAELPRRGAATAGTWTVVQDSSTPGRAWGRITWNTEPQGSVPAGASLIVEARAADTEAALAGQAYEAVTRGGASGLAGRFIEVRVSFRRSAGGETPVLSDIRIPAAGNSSPVAVDNPLSTNRSTPGTVNVLANDSDPDGDTLSVRESTNGAHGTVDCTPAGACTYAPAPGYGGPDSFTYAVSDGRGGADTASVAVTVVNRAPVAVGDVLTTAQGAAESVNVLANDSDPDRDVLTVVAKTDGGHGTVSCTSAGSCTYTPTAGYSRPDAFTYTVSDGHGGSAAGTVSVTVRGR